jgi:uncharacterized membrane protein YbhN (UPF0104 family)
LRDRRLCSSYDKQHFPVVHYIILDAIGVDLRVRAVENFLYIAECFNQFLLSSIGGDAVRVYMAQKADVGLSRAITSVFLERVVTVTGLILLVVIMPPVLTHRIGDNPAIYISPVLAAISALGIVTLLLLGRLPKRILRFDLLLEIEQLGKDARSLFLSP